MSENLAERVSQTTKWVWVTGASRGLGLSIAKNLLSSGYSVLAASRNNSEALRALITEHQDRIKFESFDLSALDNIHYWCNSMVRSYGAPYALINNAAIAHDGILGTMHESQIANIIRVNVTGTMFLTKYVTRAMLKNRAGRVVNISSIIANTGFSGLSVYAASKAALNGFTRSLARELGKVEITVNAVAPGYMKTDMSSSINDEQLEQIQRRSALRRLAEPEEVASAVVYLLSPAAAAITGTVITIDAGNTA